MSQSGPNVVQFRLASLAFIHLPLNLDRLPGVLAQLQVTLELVELIVTKRHTYGDAEADAGVRRVLDAFNRMVCV